MLFYILVYSIIPIILSSFNDSVDLFGIEKNIPKQNSLNIPGKKTLIERKYHSLGNLENLPKNSHSDGEEDYVETTEPISFHFQQQKPIEPSMTKPISGLSKSLNQSKQFNSSMNKSSSFSKTTTLRQIDYTDHQSIFFKILLKDTHFHKTFAINYNREILYNSKGVNKLKKAFSQQGLGDIAIEALDLSQKQRTRWGLISETHMEKIRQKSKVANFMGKSSDIIYMASVLLSDFYREIRPNSSIMELFGKEGNYYSYDKLPIPFHDRYSELLFKLNLLFPSSKQLCDFLRNTKEFHIVDDFLQYLADRKIPSDVLEEDLDNFYKSKPFISMRLPLSDVIYYFKLRMDINSIYKLAMSVLTSVYNKYGLNDHIAFTTWLYLKNNISLVPGGMEKMDGLYHFKNMTDQMFHDAGDICEILEATFAYPETKTQAVIKKPTINLSNEQNKSNILQDIEPESILSRYQQILKIGDSFLIPNERIEKFVMSYSSLESFTSIPRGKYEVEKVDNYFFNRLTDRLTQVSLLNEENYLLMTNVLQNNFNLNQGIGIILPRVKKSSFSLFKIFSCSQADEEIQTDRCVRRKTDKYLDIVEKIWLLQVANIQNLIERENREIFGNMWDKKRRRFGPFDETLEAYLPGPDFYEFSKLWINDDKFTKVFLNGETIPLKTKKKTKYWLGRLNYAIASIDDLSQDFINKITLWVYKSGAQLRQTEVETEGDNPFSKNIDLTSSTLQHYSVNMHYSQSHVNIPKTPINNIEQINEIFNFLPKLSKIIIPLLNIFPTRRILCIYLSIYKDILNKGEPVEFRNLFPTEQEFSDFTSVNIFSTNVLVNENKERINLAKNSDRYLKRKHTYNKVLQIFKIFDIFGAVVQFVINLSKFREEYSKGFKDVQGLKEPETIAKNKDKDLIQDYKNLDEEKENLERPDYPQKLKKHDYKIQEILEEEDHSDSDIQSEVLSDDLPYNQYLPDDKSGLKKESFKNESHKFDIQKHYNQKQIFHENILKDENIDPFINDPDDEIYQNISILKDTKLPTIFKGKSDSSLFIFSRVMDEFPDFFDTYIEWAGSDWKLFPNNLLNYCIDTYPTEELLKNDIDISDVKFDVMDEYEDVISSFLEK